SVGAAADLGQSDRADALFGLVEGQESLEVDVAVGVAVEDHGGRASSQGLAELQSAAGPERLLLLGKKILPSGLELEIFAHRGRLVAGAEDEARKSLRRRPIDQDLEEGFDLDEDHRLG